MSTELSKGGQSKWRVLVLLCPLVGASDLVGEPGSKMVRSRMLGGV